PSQPNRAFLDHATELPRIAKSRNPQLLSQSDAPPPDRDSVIVRSVLRPEEETRCLPAGPPAYVDPRHAGPSAQRPVGAATLPLLPKLFQCNGFNLRDDFATFGKLKTVPRHSCDVRKNPVSFTVFAKTYRDIDLIKAIPLSRENPSLETVKNR